MAANFWASTHQKALLPRDSLGDGHGKDLELGLTHDQIRSIKSFHTTVISDLAKAMKLRQRVSATAAVYFRRFYVRNCFADHDPRLVSQACLYLAAKAEECTVQARLVEHYFEKRQQRAGTVGVRDFSTQDILDYELQVLEDLDYNLVVFHAYHPFMMLSQDANLIQEHIDSAWAILNDAYHTDLPLIYSPHMLAIGAICLAAEIKQQPVTKWLETLRIDAKQVFELSLELLNLYDNFRAAISQDECYSLLKLVTSDTTQAQQPSLAGAQAQTPS